MREKPLTISLIAKNKKAFFDYDIIERYEAGIILSGAEVKSIRAGRVQLKGSFVQLIQKQLVVVNMHVSPYKFAPDASYNPTHTRVLLLKKKEIDGVCATLGQKGLTVIPLEIYFKGNLIKVLIGVCRGRKQHDKRQVLRERTVQREIQQKIKFR